MTEQINTSNLENEGIQSSSNLSILHGPSNPPLVTLTLSQMLDLQCRKYGDRECLVIPWTGARWTYNYLQDQSIILAKMLLDVGIMPGDRIGIMAGNCEQYVAALFAVARLGAILVVLNNTYTTPEAIHAMRHTECRILFTTLTIGTVDNSQLLQQLSDDLYSVPTLDEIIILNSDSGGFRTYEEVMASGKDLPSSLLDTVQRTLRSHEVCMLLFTSGSTGNPKAASLTHHNVINNSRFIGDRMKLTKNDVLCCPPPLFHCFGLVLGLLACFSRGAKVIYPAEVFSAQATLQAIYDESCTALHGVPAMFDSIFSLPRDIRRKSSLRTGIVAGSPVPRHIMEKMVNDFGMTDFTSSYGLTEASPTCFNAFTKDSIKRKLTTVGTLMPHAHAKIVDAKGCIVPIGQRGELYIAGYQLQSGYWQNPEKTAEAMEFDQDGVLWLKTGDEAVFDRDGYCTITGRFKDLIIRGGENIYPLEIEDRLHAHPSIERAIVVGINHGRLGEVVGAVLQQKPGATRPTNTEVQAWIQRRLGRHKSPQHIFWLGENGMPLQIPLTGSGKIQKYVLKAMAEQTLFSAAKL